MITAHASHPVRVYVWEIPVRATHWLIACSIILLSITGFYIGHPVIGVSGSATQSFFMGWVRVVHGYTAFVFISAVLARIIWMFTGNKYAQWNQFLPVPPKRRRAFMPTVLFYSFLRDKPPAAVGHNPLAGFAYVFVFGLYLLAILTGLMLRGWFTFLPGWFGGIEVARFIHHAVMYLLLGFMLHHVYSSILMAFIEKNALMDSIFTGYKWVDQGDLDE